MIIVDNLHYNLIHSLMWVQHTLSRIGYQKIVCINKQMK